MLIQKSLSTGLLVLVVVSIGGEFVNADNPNTTDWPIRFRDDLRVDRRDQYKHGDKLKWQPGKMSVDANVAFWHEVTPGARLELDIELQLPNPNANFCTEFVIPYRAGKAIIARMEREPEKDNKTEFVKVSIWIEDYATQLRKRTLLNHDMLASTQNGKRPYQRDPSGKWRFVYRYGHLRILHEGKLVLSGYVSHTKSVAGIICRQKTGAMEIMSYALRAAQRPPDKYTEEQRNIFAKAAQAMELSQKAFEINNMPVALTHAEIARDGFETVLGEKHPYTLQAAGKLVLAMGDFPNRQAECRLLLDRLLKLNTEVYGEGHPEVADLWTRMAGAYLKNEDSVGAMRCYSRAVDLYLQSEGPLSYRRGVALVQLG
ncbi:MAG: hypothetical protein KDA84_07585, partial [Planctomycetaceae bacterium]|nr:hypothetical protein [Planctomycetaceae bacterium]